VRQSETIIRTVHGAADRKRLAGDVGALYFARVGALRLLHQDFFDSGVRSRTAGLPVLSRATPGSPLTVRCSRERPAHSYSATILPLANHKCERTATGRCQGIEVRASLRPKIKIKNQK
jgi:hypothetical protein